MKALIVFVLILPMLAFARGGNNLTVRCENGGVYTFTPMGNGKVDRQGNWLWIDIDYEGKGWIVHVNSLQNKFHCDQVSPAHVVKMPTRPLPKVKCENVYVQAGTYDPMGGLGIATFHPAHYECL